MLLISLVGVVLLAKSLSPAIEAAVANLGAPRAAVGIVIALLVLAPEGFAAVRAARANRVQTSLNLAIGSALATIGLTIPAVAGIALYMNLDLALGLTMSNTVLLVLTLLVASLTLGTGRTTLVQCTLVAARYGPYLKNFYKRIRARKGACKSWSFYGSHDAWQRRRTRQASGVR